MMPVKGFFFQVLLLSIISLTASLFTVRRMGEGDWFEGTGNIKCDELSAYMDSSGHGCRCRYGKTLSTEKLTCITYQERAYYRFQRKEIFNTFVTNVYAFCGNNEFCALKSTATKTELPIEKSYHNIPLNAESDCVVNFVEIIHDCVPRRVDLKFIFKSPTESDNLYLKLNKTVPLSYLGGELFQADVTCRAEHTNGKLLFKFNGTRILSDRGSFPDIPPYNRSETYCSTNNKNHPNILTYGASVGGAVILVVILVVIVICFIRCRRRNNNPFVRYGHMHPMGDVDAGHT